MWSVYIETDCCSCTASFLVAWAISFSSLFVQRRAKLSAAGQARGARVATSRNSTAICITSANCLTRLSAKSMSLKGAYYEHETWNLPMPTTGLMTAGFSKDDGWRPIHGGDAESLQLLKPVYRESERRETQEA